MSMSYSQASTGDMTASVRRKCENSLSGPSHATPFIMTHIRPTSGLISAYKIFLTMLGSTSSPALRRHEERQQLIRSTKFRNGDIIVHLKSWERPDDALVMMATCRYVAHDTHKERTHSILLRLDEEEYVGRSTVLKYGGYVSKCDGVVSQDIHSLKRVLWL